ncbi:Uncharacterised protein [Yokenella regensburgei]|nr:Uncharacterised protein [Yokenella regensburgei]
MAHKTKAAMSGRQSHNVLLKRDQIISLAAGGQNQPFGSMPRLRSSDLPSSFSQLLVLVFSSKASSSNCLRNSAGMRIGSIGDFPPPFGCLSLDIDMHMPIGLSLSQIGIYTNTCRPIKTTPRTAGTVPGRLTTTLNQ